MQRIAIVGGGLMGAGIAQVFATAGHQVRIYEPNESVRESLRARLIDHCRSLRIDPHPTVERIETTDDLADAVAHADFVTEAAPEKLELKRQLFTQLIAHAPRSAILASNTSVIPIGFIADGFDTAERIVGTHWWNPPTLIPLVEVVQAAGTSDATIAATMELLTSIGKKPAHVRKDVAGFVANRLQHALWREAIAMVADGICDAETLDHCVKNSFGMRLAVLGPLENADLVGLDLTLDIHRTLIPELDRHAEPHEFLAAQVNAGRLGFKSGSGFRSWSAEDIAAVRQRLTDHLLNTRQSVLR